jgi:hypothetical protein
VKQARIEAKTSITKRLITIFIAFSVTCEKLPDGDLEGWCYSHLRREVAGLGRNAGRFDYEDD